MSPLDSLQKGLDRLSQLNSLYEREMPHFQSSLFDAAHYHFKNPGKSFRAYLALSSGDAVNQHPKDSLHWAAACELLHNASLVHDDISDASTHRRGQASISQRFGSDMALCLGDWMIGKAFELAARNSTHSGQLVALLAGAMQETCSGQIADIDQRMYAPISDWQRIAKNKTAPLLIAPIKGAAICAGLDSHASNIDALVEFCGLAYQGRNDIDDIVPSSHLSSDLHGRKPNLVVSIFANLETTDIQAFKQWYCSIDQHQTNIWQKRIASSEAILHANQRVESWLAQAENLMPNIPHQLQPVTKRLIFSVKPPKTQQHQEQSA